MHDRIAGRRMRVGVFGSGVPLFDGIFPSGSDLVAGRGEGATLVLPAWVGPNALVLERGHLLHMRPGMRVNMCHDGGVDRVMGTYEELEAQRMTLPIEVIVGGANIRIQAGLSLFVKYLSLEEPDWPAGIARASGK